MPADFHPEFFECLMRTLSGLTQTCQNSDNKQHTVTDNLVTTYHLPCERHSQWPRLFDPEWQIISERCLEYSQLIRHW